MREVLLFEETYARILSTISESVSGLYVVNVYGNRLSGKRHLCQRVLEKFDGSKRCVSLSEIFTDDSSDSIHNLHELSSRVLLEYETLSSSQQAVLKDYILTVSYGATAQIKDHRRRIWLITSKNPIREIEARFHVPGLCTDTELHHNVCVAQLSGFEIDSRCPLQSILVGSTRKLALGELTCLVNKAKLYALDSSQPLSCHHLARAFNGLVLPTSRIDCVTFTPNPDHICDFTFTRSTTHSIDSIIGLSDETRSTLSAFLSSTVGRKMLVIAGPVGSGKSHLARTITYDPNIPSVRATSADILRSRIGDTEKTLHETLMANKTLIIEDIDKLFPSDRSDSNGSVQRCLPVLLSFLDRFGKDPDRLIVGTTRRWDEVTDVIASRIELIELDGTLSFETKIKLIKSENPKFDESSVKQFDLIHLNNRSECIQFARNMKFDNLRKIINYS